MTVPRSIFRLIPILLIVIGSALAACVVPAEVPVTGDGPAAESQPLRIVTSGSIVADWVRQIGGDHVEVSALVPPGGRYAHVPARAPGCRACGRRRYGGHDWHGTGGRLA